MLPSFFLIYVRHPKQVKNQIRNPPVQPSAHPTIQPSCNPAVEPQADKRKAVRSIRSGSKIYVRYWNSRGAWSYALLDVLRDNQQSKSTYSNAWREGFIPVNGRVFGDRVMTEQELTYTITAGRDGLDKLEVDELRDLQRAYCVQVYDVDQEAWKDCYVQDMTTQNSGGNRQELTFTIEMPHEYTFTRRRNRPRGPT